MADLARPPFCVHSTGRVRNRILGSLGPCHHDHPSMPPYVNATCPDRQASLLVSATLAPDS
eukprot:311852-Amphidinium_carterae.1